MEDAHVAVLLEEVRGEFKVFGESLQATNDKMDRLAIDMSDVKDRLTGVEGRLTGVEGRLTDVEGRLTGVEGRLTDVDGRLTGVEGRLTGVEGRLTNVAHALTGGLRPLKKRKWPSLENPSNSGILRG